MRRALSSLVVSSLLFAACGGGGGDGGAVGSLQETATMAESASERWWVNSGGIFDDQGSGGSTIKGELPSDNVWHQRYARSNPGDTDGGSHPQNIFRLLDRRTFQNPRQHLEFNVAGIHASGSPNRNDSNGVLLMQRYSPGGETLYYGGVRVDGQAVVKKKVGGDYSTLAIAPIFPGKYNRQNNPNLIPTGRWIALDVSTRTNADGSVTIDVSVDGTLVLEAVDNGRIGGAPYRDPGFVGIRTDFMDVDFRNYDASEQ